MAASVQELGVPSNGELGQSVPSLKQPLFSVVIPVYNKEKYVARALESVLSQTFQDFEIVAVLDPSKDDSEREVARFTDPRIKVFRRDRPGPGGYAARNLGLRMAHGTWVAFLDADDEWLPWHLEKLRAIGEAFPDVRFLSAGWVSVRAGGEKLDGYSVGCGGGRGAHLVSRESFFRQSYLGRRPVHTSVACVKREGLSEESGLFPESSDAARGGDLHAWKSMMCRHGALAWSDHIGARYFLDIDGQVTNVAPTSLALFDRNLLDSLRSRLTNSEVRWFNKYGNRQLMKMLLREKRGGRGLNDVRGRINWPFDAVNGAIIWCVSWTPSIVIRLLARMKLRLR